MSVDVSSPPENPTAIDAVPLRHPWRLVAAIVILILVALFVYQRHADGERPGGTPIRSPGGLFVSLIREIAQGHQDLARALTTMRTVCRMMKMSKRSERCLR